MLQDSDVSLFILINNETVMLVYTLKETILLKYEIK